MRPHLSKLRVFVLGEVLSLAIALVPAAAHARDRHASPPDVIDLPAGFRPEGITRGDDDTLYVANFDHGDIFVANARTGKGHILVKAPEGRMGLGIHLDERTNYLFVAGGATGHAYVYDADSGATVADVVLTTGTTFVNDLVITRDAVYFTDSFQPFFYRLSLGRGGHVPHTPEVTKIPLSGDYQFFPTTDPASPIFNANGIVPSPDHDALIMINSKNGVLYRVDPDSGKATAIKLAGDATLPTGDGLVLEDDTLFVVQNTNNVAVVELGRKNRGRIVANFTNPHFDTLATAVLLHGALYITNARFQVSDPVGQPFTVVRLPIED